MCTQHETRECVHTSLYFEQYLRYSDLSVSGEETGAQEACSDLLEGRVLLEAPFPSTIGQHSARAAFAEPNKETNG